MISGTFNIQRTEENKLTKYNKLKTLRHEQFNVCLFFKQQILIGHKLEIYICSQDLKKEKFYHTSILPLSYKQNHPLYLSILMLWKKI